DVGPGLDRDRSGERLGGLRHGGERFADVVHEHAREPAGGRLTERLEELVVAVPATDIAEPLAPRVLAQLEDAVGKFAVELRDASVEMAANRCRVGEDGLVDLDESRPHGRSYFFAAIKPARK